MLCKACNKDQENGEFMGKNNRVCSTCKICRNRVLKSVKKNQKLRLTQRKKLEIFEKYINGLDNISTEVLLKQCFTG
jgi:hypothetical protein